MNDHDCVLMSDQGVIPCKFSDLEVLVAKGFVEKRTNDQGDYYRITSLGQRYYEVMKR